VRQFGIVGLVETWVEELGKIEKLLPECKWECQGAKRGKKKGRAAGGIITGLKLGIKEKKQEKREKEGCLERNVQIGNKWCKIMTVYSKEMKTTRRGVEDTIKEIREKSMLIQREEIEENGWEVLNGNKQVDEEGEWTYRYK
jgi:hypothetical protein